MTEAPAAAPFHRFCTFCGTKTPNEPEPINAPCSPSLKKCQQWRENRPILRRMAAICDECKETHAAVSRALAHK